MSTDALITMVQQQPNRELISSLSPDSDFLRLHHIRFKQARSKMRKSTVIAFFETEETPTIANVCSLV